MTDRSPFTKIVRLGNVPIYAGPANPNKPVSVYCKIQWCTQPYGNDEQRSRERLSITGVEGPMANGNARGGCGQIVMSLSVDSFVSFAPGWNASKVAEFLAAWDRWHLNDMVAGSPAQQRYLRGHPITDRLDYYTTACTALAAAGLNPDPSYIHEGKPYEYGHAWLYEEVPDETIDFLRSLPDTDRQPAWV